MRGDYDKRLWLALASILVLLLTACSVASGLPKQPGDYDIQGKSISYDGEAYSFHWVDKDNSVHPAHVENIKMAQDARTFLQVGDKEPVLHLAPEEPIAVQGEDRQGGFSSFWFPFLLGQTLGGGFNRPYAGTPETPRNVPTYHYPPASDFGRDDQLNGSVTTNKPAPPDYGKVAPAPNAVSGKSAGAGGGTASTEKSDTISGKSGGAGSGSAASEKGGFKSGSNSFSSKSSGTVNRVGGGSGKSGSSSTGSSKSGGSSGSSKSSGGRAGGGGRGGGK